MVEEPGATADRISLLEETLLRREETIRALNTRLAAIYASRTWQVGAACSRLLNRILPKRSHRRRLVGNIARGILKCLRRAQGTNEAGKPPASKDAYLQWIAENEPSVEDLARQAQRAISELPSNQPRGSGLQRTRGGCAGDA